MRNKKKFNEFMNKLNISIYIRFRYENYLLCKIYNTEPYEK